MSKAKSVEITITDEEGNRVTTHIGPDYGHKDLSVNYVQTKAYARGHKPGSETDDFCPTGKQTVRLEVSFTNERDVKELEEFKKDHFIKEIQEE